MNNVFLLTGGNIGDRLQYLQSAANEIEGQAGMIVQKSSIYETAAWGNTDQQPFLNQVLEINTNLTAERLLVTILDIEKTLGRERFERMGPRTIDIDIIFYSDQITSTATLQVPHPQLQNRRFVLTPLNEVASEFIHPHLKKSVSQLLAECSDSLEVKKL